jgi:ankyrin repeat domain-containing protein 50
MTLISGIDADDYESSLARPADGTCHWILQHPTFNAWLNEASSTLLWLKGHPGCGKTVLSVFLADHFATWKSPSAPRSVLTFFCDDKITTRRDANSILLSLIAQVVTRHRSLLRRHVKKVFENQGSAMARNFTTLWRICVNLIEDPRCGSTLIILDGIDECETKSRRKLLNHIKTLLETSSKTGANVIKFIVTSRPSVFESDVVAEHIADYSLFIDKGQAGYLSDLKIFVQQRVDEISHQRRFSPDLKNFMETKLLKDAGETFLWAQMVLDALENSVVGSKKDFQQMLSKIPRDLGETYLGFVRGIPTDNQDTALKLLLLLLSSSRPLSMEELNISSTLEQSHRSTDQVDEDAQVDMPRSVHQVLGPLVKVTGQSISLLHQSVKDFLVNDSNRNDLPLFMRTIDMKSANLTIAEACIRYLLLDDFTKDLADVEVPSVAGSGSIVDSVQSMKGEPATYAEDHNSSPAQSLQVDMSDFWATEPEEYQQDFVNIFKDGEVMAAESCELLAAKYGFYAYAALHWAEHYAAVEAIAAKPLINAASELFDLSTPQGSKWWQFFAVESVKRSIAIPNSPSPVTVTAFFDLEAAFHAELEKIADDSQGQHQDAKNDALFWASHEGHDGIVRALLIAGADPNVRNRNSHTPLTIASLNGHKSCVTEITLDNRTDINMPGDKGKTALMYACNDQHFDVIQELFRRPDVAVSVPDRYGATAMHWACRPSDNDRIISALHQHDSMTPHLLNYRDNAGQTALSWAAADGNKSAVKLLLGFADIDPNIKDSKGMSALLHAAANGHSSVVRLLLQNPDVDTTAVNDDQLNAYALAAKHNRVETIRRMYKLGVPGIDQPDVDGWTPLAWAIQHPSADATEALVATGAVDIERRDKAGKTALYWTASYGFPAVVQSLLNAGASPRVIDNDGKSPLIWPIEYGYILIVRMLLAAGADPLQTDNNGTTPLSLAREKGLEEMVEELSKYVQEESSAEVQVEGQPPPGQNIE